MSQARQMDSAFGAAHIDHFIDVIGAQNVLVETQDMAGYLEDWTLQFKGEAIAILRPASTAEVSQIVTYCAAQEIAVVPQGGRTGLCGGGVPIGDRDSIVLSLSRMNAIRDIDTAARTVVVEAGVVLETLHGAALEHDLVFPLMFGAKGSCTIGGALATNAGGSNVVRYGNTRELCIGIEAVMPNGEILNALTGLRKDNTGYDLRNLLIGAEGTLGVITAAVFKLAPQPVTRLTAFLSVASLGAATQILNRLQDFSGGAVEAFEYMPRALMQVICAQFPKTRNPLEEIAETGILIEIASSRALDAQDMPDGSSRLNEGVMELLGELIEEELVLDAMIAQSEQQRSELWQMRECVLEAITMNGPAYHLDLSLPLSKVEAFVSEMDAFCLPLGLQPLTVGHLGDGNLHYALCPAKDADWDALPIEKAKEQAFSVLSRLNGSFSAEHGIGQSKLAVMTALKEPSQLALMRVLKNAIDPKNIMNPGKLVPQERKQA